MPGKAKKKLKQTKTYRKGLQGGSKTLARAAELAEHKKKNKKLVAALKGASMVASKSAKLLKNFEKKK